MVLRACGFTLVAIVMPHPVHDLPLVASLWGMIKVVVGANQDITRAG
jgi:hypothetical protein